MSESPIFDHLIAQLVARKADLLDLLGQRMAEASLDDETLADTLAEWSAS